MNKKAIKNTALSYWSEEDECYVAESPLFDSVGGHGDTPQQALSVLDNQLSDAYEAYLEGRVPGYAKPGRPGKGRITLNCHIKPDTKHELGMLSQSFGCSLGEAIDFLIFFYSKHQDLHHDPTGNKTATSKIPGLETTSLASSLSKEIDKLVTSKIAEMLGPGYQPGPKRVVKKSRIRRD